MLKKIHDKCEVSRTIGSLAAAALKAEAAVTPKPGLVDRENSGAHRDMDYPLFLASSRVLSPYFSACCSLGMEGESISALREAGLAAEKTMFAETGGVNTHKGMIFSMGILCYCAGQELAAEGQDTERQSLRKLQRRCAETAGKLLLGQNLPDTNGAKVLRETGVGGIRKEALSGFASAFEIGLPALRESLAVGLDLNTALVKTLLVLMTETEDSNAVHRGGKEGLGFMRKQAAELLQENFAEEKTMDHVRDFDRICTQRNLSPGGSADLLAMTIMLQSLFGQN